MSNHGMFGPHGGLNFTPPMFTYVGGDTGGVVVTVAPPSSAISTFAGVVIGFPAHPHTSRQATPSNTVNAMSRRI